MSQEFTVQEVRFREAEQPLRSIRHTVFIDEQSVPQDEEWDEFDEDDKTLHLLASNNVGEPAGTLRVVFLPEQRVKITRLAVLKAHRNKGLATELLCYALKTLLAQPPAQIFLHAQVDAIALYEKLGFTAQGNQFLEAGIVHQTMVFEPAADAIEKIYGSDVLRLRYADDYVSHIAQCVSLGRRQILISSEKLRHDIFADRAVVDALSEFARSDRRANIKILIGDASSLIGRSSPLTQLAQRLPSKVQIRVAHRDAEELDRFISVDHRHLVFFNNEPNLEGFCCYRAAPECGTLRDTFENAWTHLSDADPNLKQLNL